MEPTDFKNVIIEDIHGGPSEDTEVVEVKRPWNSKQLKFYFEKWWKLDDFEILASVTSKTTSKPQQPQSLPSGFYSKLYLKSVASTDQNEL